MKPVAADDGAHPKERKVTAQSRGGGGTSFPQLGHGEHEKMSGDVVVLQCRVGSHGACMGSARAQREARGAIFKDVLESVARNVARNGTDFRGARLYLPRATLHHGRPPLLPPPRPRPFRHREQARLAACACFVVQRAQRVFVHLSVSSSASAPVCVTSTHSLRRQLAWAIRVLRTTPNADL
jgi:hypothetical protein